MNDELLAALDELLASLPDENAWQNVGVVAVSIPLLSRIKKLRAQERPAT